MSTTSSTCSGSFDDGSIANGTTTTDNAIVPSPTRNSGRSVSFKLSDPEIANYGNLSSSRRRVVEQRLAAAHRTSNANHNGPQGRDVSATLHPTKGGPQLKDDASSITTLSKSNSSDSNDYSFTIDDEDDRKPAAKPIIKKKSLHPAQGGPRLQDTDSISVSTAATGATSLMATEEDDIETGKMAKRDGLVKSSSKSMPTATATVVGSIPDADEHAMRPRSDRDLAAIVNADNLVEAKLVEEGNRKPAAKKKKRGSKKVVTHPDDIQDEPKRYCFNHLKRRGCIGLIAVAIVLLIAIIVVSITVPASRSTFSTTSAALDGGATTSSEIPVQDVETTVEDVAEAPEVDLTPPEEVDSERMAALKRVIQFYDITPAEVFADSSTPQYAALDWLANKDTGSSYSMADDVRILQRYVLATLFYSTRGDNWENKYNFLSEEHECKWFETEKDWLLDMSPTTHGIKCGDGGWFDFEESDDEHIMEIRLESNNLDGQLPSEINALFLLNGIYMNNNKLRGKLDSDAFDIPNLREVELQQNDIFAEIPTELPDSLEKLDMTSNRLVGQIPSKIWTLENLSYLSLGNNPDLTGSIGAEVDQTKLQVINLNDVDLSGSSLPESLSKLSLQVFEVANCGLVGSVPDIFVNSYSLQMANLSGNSLTGSIPVSLGGYMHPNLSTINFENNNMSGEIPWGLSKNFALTYLGLAGNNFTGQVPWQFNSFLYLSTLTLHNNKLHGEVDTRLCFVKTLTADCTGEQPEIACSCCDCNAE